MNYVNWFGNRGVILLPNFVKKMWHDDKYIYWIPNNVFQQDNPFFTTEDIWKKKRTIACAYLGSDVFEVADEVVLPPRINAVAFSKKWIQ